MYGLNSMDLRRLNTWLLAWAGALLGHVVGYTAARPSRALEQLSYGSHAYMGPLAAVLVPVGLAAVLVAAVRAVRRNGGGVPTARELVTAQIAVYLVQEVVERIPGSGSPLAAFGSRAVWFGLAAQVLVALLAVRLVRFTASVVRQVLHASPRIVEDPPAPLVPAPSPVADPSHHLRLLPHRRGPPAGAGAPLLA